MVIATSCDHCGTDQRVSYATLTDCDTCGRDVSVGFRWTGEITFDLSGAVWKIVRGIKNFSCYDDAAPLEFLKTPTPEGANV